MTEKQLGNMDFYQVVFLAEMLLEKEQKTEKQLMRASVLQVWLTGGAKNKSYEDFCKAIGLGEDIISSSDVKQEDLKKAHDIIDKVNKLRLKSK